MKSPWEIYYSEIETLFGQDPDITIEKDFDDDEDKVITLKVENTDKADALEELLPAIREFGNINVEICIVPANREKEEIDLFKDAFRDNPVFSFVLSQTRAGVPYDFVVFKKAVAQYYNDDLSDVNGFYSGLYQDIAKDVFKDARVKFCTDKGDADD